MQITNISLTVALLAVAALLSPQPVYSQLTDYTVAQLLEPCMEGDNDSRWGGCCGNGM